MNDTLRGTAAPLVYVLSAVFFFLGLKAVVKVRTAARGRPLIAIALLMALLGTTLEVGSDLIPGLLPFMVVSAVIGVLLARGLPLSPAPAKVAWIPGTAGVAVALVGAGILQAAKPKAPVDIAAALAVAFGGVGFLMGLGLAAVKRESGRSNALASLTVVLAGAAVGALGFSLHNVVLVVIGGVAGAAGLALGRIMAKAAGRSLVALLFGGGATAEGYRNVRSCGAEEAAMILETASNIVIVPGFGMAAAQAQHAVAEMASLLRKKGAKVLWAVHPDAGCVPGHMNIVLDEANVGHEPVLSLSDAQDAIAAADAVVVVGANDVVNPASNSDRGSPVFGLAAPDLSKARSVFVIKRSLRAGTMGVSNPLFEQQNTTMLFGDAKKVAQALVAELKGAGGH